jgi:fatty acid desaturase
MPKTCTDPSAAVAPGRAEAYPIPLEANALRTATVVSLLFFQWFGLPLLLRQEMAWAACLFVLLPLHAIHWGLIHEAIHGHLHPDTERNRIIGRGLSILFGSSFHVLRFGHLMHHRFNRAWESELYDPARARWWQRAPGYYATLFGGLYFTEMLAALLLLLPQGVILAILNRAARGGHAHLCQGGPHPAEAYFLKRGRLQEAREDAALMLAIHALAFAAYGAYWPWLLAMLAGRALVVSFLDNLHHYATPADNSLPAWEYRLWPPLSRLLMHVNHHHTHHRMAQVPWLWLPHAQATHGIGWGGSFWRGALAQLQGPIPAERA